MNFARFRIRTPVIVIAVGTVLGVWIQVYRIIEPHVAIHRQLRAAERAIRETHRQRLAALDRRLRSLERRVTIPPQPARLARPPTPPESSDGPMTAPERLFLGTLPDDPHL